MTKFPQLILMRHAKSDWTADYETDIERPLNQRGRKSAKKIANWMQRQNIQPDLVLYSTAIRAWQTMDIACQFIDDGVKKGEQGIYGANHRDLIELLSQVDPKLEHVMLIGHNPEMDALLHLLIDDHRLCFDDGKVMPTAAVAVLKLHGDWDQLKSGSCELLHHVRPSML